MAGALGIAAVLNARLIKVVCPHCGHMQRVERRPLGHRLCDRCQQRFPDPVASRRR
jgi:ribosomal protein L37AE/L43A